MGLLANCHLLLSVGWPRGQPPLGAYNSTQQQVELLRAVTIVVEDSNEAGAHRDTKRLEVGAR